MQKATMALPAPAPAPPAAPPDPAPPAAPPPVPALPPDAPPAPPPDGAGAGADAGAGVGAPVCANTGPTVKLVANKAEIMAFVLTTVFLLLKYKLTPCRVMGKLR